MNKLLYIAVSTNLRDNFRFFIQTIKILSQNLIQIIYVYLQPENQHVDFSENEYNFVTLHFQKRNNGKSDGNRLWTKKSWNCSK